MGVWSQLSNARMKDLKQYDPDQQIQPIGDNNVAQPTYAVDDFDYIKARLDEIEREKQEHRAHVAQASMFEGVAAFYCNECGNKWTTQEQTPLINEQGFHIACGTKHWRAEPLCMVCNRTPRVYDEREQRGSTTRTCTACNNFPQFRPWRTR